MKIYVTDFSVAIGTSVFKLCVHLQAGKVYCVNKIKRLILLFSSFFKFSIFLLSLLYKLLLWTFFSVKNYSATTRLSILKFGTKLDSDESYCVTKKSRILLISPFIFHFPFSPVKVSVADFSTPIGTSVFKLCVHLQVG